jgi:hypothetical protein
MNTHDEERLKYLLKQSLPAVDAEPARDLWPAVLHRLRKHPAAPPWFDWALAAALLALLAFVPVWIPMMLYYL